jgi:hypothetical protein
MSQSDEFSSYLGQLLSGTYDCADRISIRGWFPLGQTSGGMLAWWDALFPGQSISDQSLQKMAGDFARRLYAYAQKHSIPLEHFEIGDRTKHARAEALRAQAAHPKGLFAIFVARAPGLVWHAYKNRADQLVLRRRKKWPLINHYHFHILDPEWGHITIRMSGHPPFGVQISVNGHEWVQQQAAARGILWSKDDNCFVHGSDLRALDQIARRLDDQSGLASLWAMIDRWVYSACLCFALNDEQQRRCDFRFSYSCYQIEYSRNLIFKSGRQLDQVYQGLLDRTRRLLDVPQLKTIFGRKNRPHLRGRASGRLEKILERSSYNLTVFKLHFGKLTLKMYDKGDRVLRVEVVVNNIVDLHCGKRLENLPGMLQRLEQMVVRFLAVVQAAHLSFLDAGTLEKLAKPGRLGAQRLAGVEFDRGRMCAVSEAVVALAAAPHGFTAKDLVQRVRLQQGQKLRGYRPRKAAYDLRKLRAKSLVERIRGTRRYRVRQPGIQTLAGLLILQEKVIKPVLAGIRRRAPAPNPTAPIDAQYLNLQREMLATLQALHLTPL